MRVPGSRCTCRGPGLAMVIDRVGRLVRREPDAARAAAAGQILLVEDEPAVRALARRILEREGYSVVEAGTGLEAAQLVEREVLEPDLVVTDVIMPEMGGAELVQRLRARRPGIRSVFMSGYAADELTSRGLRREEENFLPKPFTPAQLVEVVRSAIND